MEASSVCKCNTMVPEALGNSNYEIWSSCMEDYLSIQDLWDVIIEDEPQESLSDSSKNDKKSWRKKNLMALHAIKMSCGPNFISKVVKLKSAKQAWDLLAAADDDDEDDDDEENDTIVDGIDYAPFKKDVNDEDWESIEKFIDAHPQAVTATVFYEGGTVLHYLLDNGDDKNAALLVNRVTVDDMEILDENGYTTLAVGANKMYPGRLQSLKLMVSKHPNLPNIGNSGTLPVILAAFKGLKETTRYLYSVTDKNIFNPESGTVGVTLLIDCIEGKIFDVASKLVQKFPNILWKSDDCYKKYPVQAFAAIFCTLFSSKIGQNKSGRLNFGEHILNYVHRLLGRDNKISKVSNDDELIRAQARDFLHLVCSHVSTLNINTIILAVYGATVEAATHGNIEFVNEMLSAHPQLIFSFKDDDGIFHKAIKNRRHKIFNLIYPVIDKKDALLANSDEDDNNILHLAAMVAPPHILDRTSGPALQVQTELQWFQEVWNVVNPRHREKLNKDNLTPRQLFIKSHEKLIDAGEKAMKDTAASSTVVGALIVTIMFAVAFTVPGGNDQDTGYPLFANKVLFKIFIVCDALSLYSSATSVLIFLGILTSRYAEDDFLLLLPRKLLLGISTLFFSITTMMVTFCAALAIMLNGRLQYIFPIVLLAFVPVILFLSSIFPLLSKIYKSTFGPSIFDKNTTLPSKKEYKKIMNDPSSGTDFPSKKEGENITNNSSGVVEELPTNKKEDEEIVNASSGDQLV